MLVLICISLFVVGVILIRSDELFGVGVAFVAFSLLFMLVILPVTYFSSYTTVADLQAFQKSNRQNYSIIIDQTEKAIIKIDQETSLRISLENLQQSTNWSERMKELRDNIVEYNKNLYRLKIYNDSIWLDWFFLDVPEEFVPIVLE